MRKLSNFIYAPAVYIVLATFVASLSTTSQAQEIPRPKDQGYKFLTQDSTTYVRKDASSTKRVKIEMEATSQYGATQISIFQVALPQSDSAFKLIHAFTTTDHHLYPTRPAQVEKTTQSVAGLKEALTSFTVYKIPFSHVTVGSTVSLEYEVVNPPLFPGVFQDQGGITNEFFAKNEKQEYISEIPLSIQTHGFKDFYTARRVIRDGKYIFNIDPTPMASMLEGKMVRAGTFFLSSAKSWQQLDEIISPEYRKAVTTPLPKEFQEIAQAASAEKTSAQKIETVARELKKKITYSGDWRTEKGKFFPAGHQKVVQTGRGDCKDFATSMAAILQKIGFQSEVALSFRNFGNANHKFMKEMVYFPSLTPFNHAIVWAKDAAGKQWWVDPTNPHVIADVLSSDLLGNFALILDGKSEKPVFLPEKNAHPWKSKWDQTIEVKPDNSVHVTSRQEYNDTAFNTMTLIENLYGKEGMETFFSRTLNPMAESKATYTLSSKNDLHVYDVNLTSKEWVDEQKQKSFSVDAPPAIAAFLFSGGRGGGLADISLGEPGLRERTTLLKNHKVIDPIPHECVIRSPWFDFEREVQIVGEDTRLTDRLEIKKSYIPYEQLEEDTTSRLLGEVSSCQSSSHLLTFLDPSEKTVAEAKRDQLKGPPVDQMSEKDVEALLNLDDHSLDDYVDKKLYRYYSKRLEKNPKDAEAAARRAFALRSMGYLVSSKYVPAYPESALKDLEDFEKQAGEPVKESRFYYVRGVCQLSLGRQKEALQTLNALKQIAPDSYDYASLGYNIYNSTKQYAQAEVWLKSALAKATRKHDKMFSQSRLADLLNGEKKYAEAAKVYEEVLKDHPTDAWEWHNAAINLFDLESYDQCITYEKKALSLMEFGAAKHTLARALLKKSELKLLVLEKQPADKKEGKLYGDASESLVLEALRWDPDNPRARFQLANIYMNRYSKDQDTDGISKAREYIQKAVALDPRFYKKGQFEMNRTLQLERTKRQTASVKEEPKGAAPQLKNVPGT